jgi:hypothetical protein
MPITNGLLSCRGDLQVLIVPFATQPHIGLTEFISSKELNFSFNYIRAAIPADVTRNTGTYSKP